MGGGRGRARGPQAAARRAVVGAAVGCWAGVPQVLAAQAVGAIVGNRDQADIGPRFVQRIAQKFGGSLSGPARWSLAALFHFAYAAGWGAAYAPTVGAIGLRRVPPPVGGGLLAGLIYVAAFSRVGAGTVTRSERPPERRRPYEWAIQLTAALTFALTLASSYRWLSGGK